ncbi:MAG: aminodeoxychorismate/anthranilate synthase component II [Defluviitaleaceae bacterium]|nr:aminodeoxychorismate/anthranilate synthase component II [Defluviitaleaceae bacterium]
MKYYMLDNHDSFVYNLVAYFKALGHEVVVENVKEAHILNLKEAAIKGIIISPGPGTPAQAKMANELLQLYGGKIPILGVCLGHQVIGHCYQSVVKKGKKPVHGKIFTIKNTGKHLFYNLPERFNVTRYHSLVIDPNTLPDVFEVDAVTEDGDIMAISHQQLPIYGVQFHPEALLTEYGHELLENFNQICEKWWENEA